MSQLKTQNELYIQKFKIRIKNEVTGRNMIQQENLNFIKFDLTLLVFALL